ncbi:purine catabolism protein PucB [bacterium BMS3Bbin02]|nr:purine catabolism protein PucB [bacterium BMS3Bbin02]HDH25278.1 nucleotidyltransferase family protein [Actinomycetota bacterium]
MTPSSDLVVVILAAGGSKRFGSAKQLADISGETLLNRVIDGVGTWAPGRIVVVLGAEADSIRQSIPDGIDMVVCSEWKSGMAASLVAGVAAVAGDPIVERCAVVMGDTLGLDSEDASAVIAASDVDPVAVVQATFRGSPSHPTVFPRSWFGRLMELSGDQGARELLRSGYENVVKVPLVKSDLIDVDTQTDVPSP